MQRGGGGAVCDGGKKENRRIPDESFLAFPVGRPTLEGKRRTTNKIVKGESRTCPIPRGVKKIDERC